MISILQEMDKCRAYLYFDANSLFDYAHRILQLSEATSSNLINVARKSVEIPALKTAIEIGTLSVSKARKIVPVLTIENQSDWIALATKNTTREIERAVAQENPELAVRESARFIADNRLELKLGFSDENYKNLKRVCDLESQRTARAVNHEKAIAAALEAYLEKYDPIRVAERSAKRRKNASTVSISQTTSGSIDESIFELKLKIPPLTALTLQRDAKRVTGHTTAIARRSSAKTESSGRATAQRKRKSLLHQIIHQINLRDGGQCTYRNSEGNRCTNRRWLEFHHVIPRSSGGPDILENLETLCSSHHRALHQNWV